jgi:cytochrome subunit of sulfide dehydrogenase
MKTALECRRNTGSPMLASVLACVLAYVPGMWTPQAQAAGQSLPAISAGARLAANCAACHGTSGITEGTVLPSLAGQGKGALLVALKAFKTGARQGTIMPQIAKGYTDEQLAQLAEYFAAQPPVPTAALPPSRNSAAHGLAQVPDGGAGANADPDAPPAARIAVYGWRQERPIGSGSGAAAPGQRFAATWLENTR